MNKKTKKEIKAFFKELVVTCCKKESTYSVIETAEKMGVDYKQVMAWAKSDEFFADDLEACRGCCACNAETAGLLKEIPSEKAFEYMAENDDQWRDDLGDNKLF